MRPFIVKFKVDLYEMDVRVFVGYDLDKTYDKVEDFVGVPMAHFDDDADVEGFALNQGRTCVVWFRDIPATVTARFAALVSHEMVHLAQQILDNIGCDSSNSTEHYVLLQEYLVRRTLEGIEKKVGQAKKSHRKKS